MAQESIDYQWQTDGRGEQPVRDRWKLFPQRQALAVVDVKGVSRRM